ncbi:MAG: plasmid stabilization protein [Gammaproteobacteria bacterium]|nr:plasmid stabilization protein [Gammaproteobacteria bacterium]
MAFRLIYTEGYVCRARKFIKKYPQIIGQYEKTLELLELNPYHPSLRLHSLQGKLSGLSSVSINMSYQIVLEMIIQDSDIILVNIGSHDRVYG